MLKMFLVADAMCCVNLEAGYVFGILILAKLWITLLGRQLWLKYASYIVIVITYLTTSYW